MAGTDGQLSREQILTALSELNGALAERGLVGEICLFGDAAMVLAYNARPATRDVDALFAPATEVRNAAREVGERLGLGDSWLNDGVKGFLSSRHEIQPANLPQFPNLRVLMPVPAYLLAMKCLASRIAQEAGEADDVRDIRFLIARLELKSAAAVLEIIAQYYPPERIPVRAQFLIETLFEEGFE